MAKNRTHPTIWGAVTHALMAELPDGRKRERLSLAPFTWNGSFPCTTVAPPLSAQFGCPCSNEPPVERTYPLSSPHGRNGWTTEGGGGQPAATAAGADSDPA